MDCTACNAALMWLGLEMREGCPGVSADLCAENGAAAGRRRERSLRMVPGETITDREVRDSVARILSSSTFALSDRHRRFLAFVVDETLAGRGNRIKAYTIATSAFGRGSDFDPQQDSIVRIEAGRLRRALEYYYLTEGSADPLRILIPKGSYVPQFARPEAPPDPGHAPGVRTTPRGPRVFVHPFEQDSGEDVFPGFGAAFTRQVVMGLTRFGTLLVYGPVATRDHPGRPARTPVSGGIDTEFVLSGTVGIAGDVVTIDLLLQEAPDGRYVWTERFERDLAASEMRALRDEVASAIVGTLGQPYGVLFSRALDHDGDAPQWLGSYRAVLDYYQFARTLDMSRIESIRLDLEKAISDDPTYAEGFACLSRVYTDMARFAQDWPEGLRHWLDRATSLARHAIALAPNSSGAHHALALALWFNQEVDESLATFRTALALNPNDTEIMADYGFRLAIRMRWEEAIPMVEESFRRNPGQATTFRMAFVIWHYCEGRHEAALREASLVGAPGVVYPHLFAAAAAAELGRNDEARAAVVEIERIAPGYGRRLVADLVSRNAPPDLVARIEASMRRAGLAGLASAAKTRIAVGGRKG